ncbi:MAG: ArsR/SmtB family transcription factor [Bacillota bacterium]|uniref:ArsR/SmtB family transcription factor n=1 Tax=Fictibacillus TaxID=1329200 RepID=UPI0018CDD6F5|nr:MULTISPECIES: metalloregulator ArsR/SmtB family transcription factor [unclassified Fictibacillus]MBH0157150.1 winged helix-turn-helix transcriptional regulator [Fictibacillus sp. 5RED26]MBH0159471.1 winged helix-turn-helix transcriptional regulator [Fictibacillus sp. 26RED30]MBH0163730.1 winged helix-turn-helix transcriptional regulator [Fictibacillus sp. 7GRE50]MBH0169644.1 winged helix-turn-helix transcriptional regulator [Fictibacillus sp. 18YEL24]MBH0174144.1 winged helix-turn-helix tra
MKSQDVCEVTCFDEKKVVRVKDEINKRNSLNVASIFKALSDETRLKIAYALTLEKELCVCDVANIVGSTTATASHHLRHLRSMGLMKYRKEGKLVFYSLDDEHVVQLIKITFTHQEEVEHRGRSFNEAR